MNTEQLAEALATAEVAGTVREAAAALRERYAPLCVVVVDAFDMRAEPPAAAGERCALYLGASDGHCWQVTQDPTQAAGLFISTRG
ncbi:hypothetical protein [Pseudaquabacterium rugosum]|uniref:Uncharacterized protein n=1 Tax=Pseudaquabacterium rugosum TaxID=2984194 RepID=A0ABU9B9D3_9BURK